MVRIDFDEHNAEVEAVWKAYHEGNPIRVPMIIGINSRVTMVIPEANPRGIDFPEYFTDPETMLTRQLEHFSWVRKHIPQDAPMGLPEAGWDVKVSFQNSYEAGWFGCDMHYFEGEVPDTMPILQEESTKRVLLEKGIPDPFADGLMERNWRFYDFFKEKQAQGFTWEGKPLASVMPTGLKTDGPVTVACNLRGASEFYTDLGADPRYANELLEFVVEATIVRIKAYRERLGMPMKTAGYGFADDGIQSISIPMYKEMVMPFHKRLIEAFSEGGTHSIHLCGDAGRFFRMLKEELNMKSFDTGYPIDFGWIREQLDEDVEIKGGPSVTFLQAATPEDVREEVRRILDSGIKRGGRFILREGNNLPPGIALENLWAMYDTVREYGVY